MEPRRARRRLYDPRTAEILRAEQGPSRLLVFSVTAIACGVVAAAAHHELPFLAHWAGACSPEAYAYQCAARPFWSGVAGVGTAIGVGGLALAGHRYAPFRPTLTCRGCQTSGWVLDIEAHAGPSPRCGGDRLG